MAEEGALAASNGGAGKSSQSQAGYVHFLRIVRWRSHTKAPTTHILSQR